MDSIQTLTNAARQNTLMSRIRQAIVHDDAQLAELVKDLRGASTKHDETPNFPSDEIQRCSAYERIHAEQNGSGGSEQNLRFYAALGFGCLTTAFIMTQRHAAVRRMESCPFNAIRELWKSRIDAGDFFTVGISHLTTSRQHIESPSVIATKLNDGWIVRGTVPWVTGASQAAGIVVGAVEITAEQNDRNSPPAQYLFLVPTNSDGVTLGSGLELMALTGSCTDVVHLDDVRLDHRHHLHGPSANVIAAATPGGGAGGFQTSALALGLAATAIEYLEEQSRLRPSLSIHIDGLLGTWLNAMDELIRVSLRSEQDSASIMRLRKQANDLALNATQSALAAARGAGFVRGHPVERWCREALFFLVWSCPVAVAEAHLCSFASNNASVSPKLAQ